MEMDSKIAGSATLTPSKSKPCDRSKRPENVNPNVANPTQKALNSPATKSATKAEKPAVKRPDSIVSPPGRNKIRERKFVVARKNSKREKSKTLASINCKCKASVGSSKCLCVAYETLRASQEGFFRIGSVNLGSEVEEEVENPDFASEFEENLREDEIIKGSGEKDGVHVKRGRDKMFEAVRQSIPQPGKVMNLIKAFENILTLPKSSVGTEEGEENEEDEMRKVSKWELTGLRPKAPETQFSSYSFNSSDLLLTPESLGLDSRVSSSSDGSKGSISNGSSGGRRHPSRQNSSESTATFGGSRQSWTHKTVKATSAQPFKLRTEQRGKSKQEKFTKKVQEVMIEQEKQRVPVAQGLPWTTDEPECLAKPPVKKSTKPVDLVLHSDVRAGERADFDHQVQEKLSYIEQFKLERERQQKMAEEEELKRLRKELVPKAQPMPYFDRPFVPRRSEKQPTIPKDPKFHNHPEHKKIKC